MTWYPPFRSLADDLRDNPRPVDTTPHVHFHLHDGDRHSHVHVHPDDHGHSARRDTPSHEKEDDGD